MMLHNYIEALFNHCTFCYCYCKKLAGDQEPCTTRTSVVKKALKDSMHVIIFCSGDIPAAAMKMLETAGAFLLRSMFRARQQVDNTMRTTRRF